MNVSVQEVGLGRGVLGVAVISTVGVSLGTVVALGPPGVCVGGVVGDGGTVAVLAGEVGVLPGVVGDAGGVVGVLAGGTVEDGGVVGVRVGVEVFVASTTGLVGVDVGGVPVGVEVGVPQSTIETSTLLSEVDPSKPPTATRWVPSAVPPTNERAMFRFGPALHELATGS